MGAGYIIKNATVVSVDPNIGTVPNGDVLIEDGFITAVGRDLRRPSWNPTVIDGTNAIVSPGFIDTHRHTWQTQLRTIGTDYVLSDYILNLRQIYGASYTVQDAYLGNYCGALDSIDNGITYLIDHSHIINSPSHADAAIKGLQDAKIRATFCYAMYPNPHWEGSCMDREREEQTPDWRLHDTKRVSEKFFKSSQPDDLLRMGFALSEPDLTPIDRLVQEIKHARSIGCSVITGHFNFGKWDPGNCIVSQLGQKGVLGPDLLLSHGNTLRDDELKMIALHECGISSTPDTELQMGMSHPVAFKAKDRGCNASLGVDVCCSAPADMFAQMRLLLQAQRHLEHEAGEGAPLKMSRNCSEVLEMATMGGARAVGLEKVIGSITPGKRADLLITRCDAPRLVPVHDPVGALVLYANGSDIDTVMINGEIVKSGGKLTNVDWPKIREELRASVTAIMDRSKKVPMEEVEATRNAMVKALDVINQRPPEGRPIASTKVARAVNRPTASPVLSPRHDFEERYVGIPKALISTLVELYFDNVYNAHLLLHRSSFIQAVISGTARPHVVLGVCAWAAVFYRDTNGQATLKDHGFMVEWAERASKLVFQELHEFHDDSIVTLVNLSIFWHGQGSWRMAILHKASACNLLSIIGIGTGTCQLDSPWESEIRRRRSWASYLLHCHNSESLSNFPVTGMEKLALPWPEADFEAGYLRSSQVTLDSAQGNGGVYAEMIKILTLWSSVITCIKMTEPSLATKLPAMYALHEKLSDWWRRLPAELRLTSANIAAVSKNMLTRILLVNVVYHQSLCALHASIVPLFCWGKGDETWSTARQLSAQLAYEHACTTSELLDAVLSTVDKFNAMPSFIAYGAYCGCAIQIPFMWSSSRSVRERANANVKANMKMINMMATYWKFAALLKIYVRCLHDGHKKHPTVLEDEPKYADPGKLTSFRVNAPHVQASILEFIGILYSKEDGYAKPGEEAGPEIEHAGTVGEEPPSREWISEDHEAAPVEYNEPQITSENHWAQPQPTVAFTPDSEEQCRPNQIHQQQQQQQERVQTSTSTLPYQPHDILPAEDPTLDIFQPLLDPEMLELFPNGELPDFSAFDTIPLDLDHFDFGGLE